MTVRAPTRRRSSAGFYPMLAVVAIAAFVFRLAYDIGLKKRFPHPDGVYYLGAAKLLREGRGFVNPFRGTPAAFHPPAWTLVLTIPQFLGKHSVLSSQIFASLIGVMTVIVVGIAARRITSDLGALIAAGIAASYPGLWVFERALLSETLLFLGVAVMVIAAYRYVAAPSRTRAIVLGGMCGLLALTRSEQILLVPTLLLPLILGWRWRDINRQRIEFLILACVTTVVVIIPWSLYNIGRIDQPVFLSTSFSSALVQGNCDSVYYGKNLGYVDYYCRRPLAVDAARHGSRHPLDPKPQRDAALRYIRSHVSRFPLVLVAREGRTWSVYKPFETAKVQYQFPHDPWWPEGLDLYYYWALLPLAVFGGFVLHRRRMSLLPLVAPFVVIVVTVATTYGEPRLRAAAAVPLVLLAAVGIEQLLKRDATRSN
jgi:4-amino-4-deoxy-L-arabinose transferase-like glycosyltransferase